MSGELRGAAFVLAGVVAGVVLGRSLPPTSDVPYPASEDVADERLLETLRAIDQRLAAPVLAGSVDPAGVVGPPARTLADAPEAGDFLEVLERIDEKLAALLEAPRARTAGFAQPSIRAGTAATRGDSVQSVAMELDRGPRSDSALRQEWMMQPPEWVLARLGRPSELSTDQGGNEVWAYEFDTPSATYHLYVYFTPSGYVRYLDGGVQDKTR